MELDEMPKVVKEFDDEHEIREIVLIGNDDAIRLIVLEYEDGE